MIRLGVVLLVLGGGVIALPDSDERLFSISRTHGPSPLDAVGIAIIVAGWGLLLRLMWRGRRAIGRSRWFAPGLVLFAAGAAILGVTVSRDLGWWWLAGAALMAAAQGAALGVASSTANSR